MNQSEIRQILFGLYPAAHGLVISRHFVTVDQSDGTLLLCWRSWVVSFMSWNWHWISIEPSLMVSSLRLLWKLCVKTPFYNTDTPLSKESFQLTVHGTEKGFVLCGRNAFRVEVHVKELRISIKYGVRVYCECFGCNMFGFMQSIARTRWKQANMCFCQDLHLFWDKSGLQKS